MGWKMYDYACTACEHSFESLQTSVDDEVSCPECGAAAKVVLSANLGWSNDASARKEMLKKRSAEHTRKEQKSGNMLSPKDLPKL